MGAYNIVRASVRCPNCGHTSEQAIQFKFGDTRLYEYTIGDTLRWGGNDIGRPGIRKVAVAGASEECPVCRARELDFSVIIERDIVVAVEQAPEGPAPVTAGELYLVVEE
jgi:hypothetical protein